MNVCTIVAFRQAVADAAERLRTLSDARMADDAAVCRSTLFAECRMTWRGGDWLVYAPIALHSMSRAERAAMALRPLISDPIGGYVILRDEMIVDTVSGAACDLVAEPLPSRLSLSESVAGMEADALLRSLEELRQRLLRLGISHNNLSPDNIAVDASGRMHPVRSHYATAGVGGDEEAFVGLAEYVEANALSSCDCLHDASSAYDACNGSGAGAYQWRGNMFEERARVRAGSLYGFVDEWGRTAVEPQYFWADDFREGRAAVQSVDGRMGLIDKSGREVIAVVYDIVEYDPDTGVSWVCLDSRWARFDYSGRRIGEWRGREECDMEL